MKKITYYIAFLFLFLLGCTSDELANAIVTEESEISEIEAISLPFDFEGGDSRTAINMGSTSIALPVWRDGDTIGIYPSAGGDQLSFPIVEGINTNKCNFTGGGWALKASTATTTYKYTAYTPFNRSYYLLRDNTALPVSMLGQKQVGNDNSDHLGAYDLQIANGDTPTSGKISFSFQHKVAIVRMDITAPCAATWKSIELESNAAFTTKAAMNLSLDVATVTPTAQSNSVTLELENVKTTESDLSIVAYMMMLPVDFTNKTLSMKLTDTDDNVYTAPVTFRNPTNIANPRKFGEANPRWISAEFEESTGSEEIPYVTFSAESTQSLTMSSVVEKLEYSVGNGEWKTLGTLTVGFGGEYGNLRLRGNNSYGTNGASISFGNNTSVSCTGDIRTLINYESYKNCYTGDASFESLFEGCRQLKLAPELPLTTLDYRCYYSMFSGCSGLTEAPVLPATTLAESCYSYMFSGCTSLINAPVLPATTLATYCYSYMFEGCTSLTKAPSLPATTLASHCYREMFYNCTSLTEAPSLPATTLASYCYHEMFYNCTSLTEAPVLPATTLASYCYYYMFSGCTSLTEAPALPATTLASYCYYYMFSGCTSLTEAPSLPATILASFCYYYMFSGCTSLTEVPALPATTLAEDCYGGMFSGCTSLTEAPALPATILASYCYSDMFYNCTSLTEAPALPATILASYCYSDMFYNCTSLTEAPALPATTLASHCYRDMFSGCTSLTEAPALPATTLASYCYAGMFYQCTSLVSAPLLPATILAENCYGDNFGRGMFEECISLIESPQLLATTLVTGCYTRMFYGCYKLNKVTMLATDISDNYFMKNWLSGVSSTGTFIKAAEMTTLPTGSDGIPSRWTVVDYEE